MLWSVVQEFVAIVFVPEQLVDNPAFSHQDTNACVGRLGLLTVKDATGVSALNKVGVILGFGQVSLPFDTL